MFGTILNSKSGVGCLAVLALASLGDPLQGQAISPAVEAVSSERISLLTLLDSSGRELVPGTSYVGELGEADLLLPSGEPVQGWSFTGGAGETIRIDLSSSDFDPYLYLVGPGLGAGLSDDDGGGGLASRICTLLSESGQFLVVASSLGSGLGEFTLALERAPAEGALRGEGCEELTSEAEIEELLESTPLTGTLEAEVPVSGILDPFDPRHPERGGSVEIWEFEAEEDTRLAFDLSSDDFDTFLYVWGAEDGMGGVLSNDDDGVGCTGSRIWVTFPVTGRYRVLVTSFEAGEEGGYRLVATATPNPDLDCNGRENLPAIEEDLSGVEVPSDRRLPRPLAPDPGADRPGDERTAVAGFEIEGTLTSMDFRRGDGSFAQGWEIEAGSGDRYTIDLISDAFDPFLIVSGPGLTTPLRDDDDGGGLDSLLEFITPEAGVYRVIVTSAGGEGSGAFTLRILRRGEAEP